jgi:DnaK suppressor protein
VTQHPPKLDHAFLDLQRGRLRALRGEMLKVMRRNDIEQQSVNAEENDHALEFEDDAQRLAANELSGNLSTAEAARLEEIDRALQKIEVGNYGYSEESGEPIPVDRLEAQPQARYTLKEQEARDRDAGKTPSV